MLEPLWDQRIYILALLFAWPILLIWIHAIVRTVGDRDISQLGAGFLAGWVKGLIASGVFWVGAALVLWLVESVVPETVRTVALFVVGIPYLATSIYVVWTTEPDL